MEAPINQFELVESIRFFGSLVATPGLSEDVKGKCNSYLLRMIEALEPAVDKACGSITGLKIVRNK